MTTATPLLVLGATGTVGASVVAHLASEGHAVRAAGRNADRTAENLADVDPDLLVPDTDLDGSLDALSGTVEPVAFDFERPETWGPAFEDVRRAFVLRPPQMGRVGAITDALDAAGRVGVEHVALLSVLGAERNPVLPHRRIEKHLADHALDHTFLRASFFAQNFLTTHRADLVERDEVFVPAGQGETSIVDARDVAAVAATALTEEGHRNVAYDLTGPEAVDYDAVADVFSAALDRPVTYPEPGLPAFARRLRSRGHDWGFVLVTCALYTTARLGLAGRVTDDVARVLGREALPFERFATDYADRF